MKWIVSQQVILNGNFYSSVDVSFLINRKEIKRSNYWWRLWFNLFHKYFRGFELNSIKLKRELVTNEIWDSVARASWMSSSWVLQSCKRNIHNEQLKTLNKSSNSKQASAKISTGFQRTFTKNFGFKYLLHFSK
jgi:hypothetical protein